MNYNSALFLLFFTTTFTLYYLIRDAKWQVLLLVISSLIFYAWETPQLLLVFLTSWLITGLTSHATIQKIRNGEDAKSIALAGVAANLALLCFFKYRVLVYDAELNSATNSIGDWLLMAPLPIGISFYTFHGISLLIDAWRGSTTIPSKDNVGDHLTKTLLYLVFFPQLISGPLIKAKDFFPQVNAKRFTDIEFQSCFRLLVLGFFLKSVIADNLSDQTYFITYPYFLGRSSVDLFILLIGYSAQIFADFAGYSLIAIGLGKLLGYKLPDNFNYPYISASIAEFWRRWHISLSSWLRDYLYIPLGGNKISEIRTHINLLIVMFLGGLWHGAAWSFAFWGLWHGIGLSIERYYSSSSIMSSQRSVAVIFRVVSVFVFVSVGWLFFRLQDFSHATAYLTNLVNFRSRGLVTSSAIVITIYASAVFLYHLAGLYKSRLSTKLIDTLYGIMLFLVLVNSGAPSPFIYFQF